MPYRNQPSGPMLAKKEIDVSALTADYVSEYPDEFPFFTITATTAGVIKYEDTLGNEFTETFAVGEFVTVGAPSGSFPVPMLCGKILRVGSTADCEVGYGP